MKKSIVRICILIYLFFRSSYSYAQYEENAIVRVYSGITNVNGKSGTGFFVNIGGVIYICTCYHLVVNSKKIDVWSSDGYLKDIYLVSYNRERDLALLSFRSPQKPSSIRYLPIATTPPFSSTQNAIAIGHPLTLKNQHVPVSFLRNGYVSSKEYSFFKPSLNLNLISIASTVYDGMSGSPIIVDHRVVGVISGSFNVGGTISWAIPSSYLNDMSLLPNPTNNFLQLPALDMFNNRGFNELTRNFKYKFSPTVDRLIDLIDKINTNNGEFSVQVDAQISEALATISYIRNSYSFKDLDPFFSSSKSPDHFGRFADQQYDDFQRFIGLLTTLRNELTDVEFYQFRRKEGVWVDAEYGRFQGEMIMLQQRMTYLTNKGLHLYSDIKINYTKKRKFNTVKSKALEIVQIGLESYNIFKRLFDLESQLFALTLVIGNAMMEYKSYDFEVSFK